jgi:hypothetical protein
VSRKEGFDVIIRPLARARAALDGHPTKGDVMLKRNALAVMVLATGLVALAAVQAQQPNGSTRTTLTAEDRAEIQQ